MTGDVLTCRPNDTLNRAAQIMWERDCGCVPVVDGENRLLGMITDRDAFMAAYTNGKVLDTMTVEQAMTHRATACKASDDLESALGAMSEKQIHRLPVVDQDDHLAGILSLADIVQNVDAEVGTRRSEHADEILAAMAAVTRPRRTSGELRPRARAAEAKPGRVSV
jgi:CBS-domain-containing membrane protein